MKKTILLIAALLFGSLAQAKVELPAVFGDNMVLQQQTDAAIFGKSDAKTVKIVSSWDKKEYTATVTNGKWKARIATPKAGGPYTIKISDNETITLKNILIGEVWLCSGQSNMEMPMKGFGGQPTEGSLEVITSANPCTPIRICTIEKAFSKTPVEQCKGCWGENTPENVAETSATAYFFAAKLQKTLNIPVGIVISCWGGSFVETWMDKETIAPFLKDIPEEFKNNKEAPQFRPEEAYNGMIAPFEGFSFKGLIWYQGESNRYNAKLYRQMMAKYVEMMRRKFVADMPFYYVQIAPFLYEKPEDISSALIREAQLQNLYDIPNSGMAVTLDVGEKHCIHPAKKKEVGDRLVYQALAKTYGIKGYNPTCVQYKSMTVEGNKAILSFENVAMGLTPNGALGATIEGFEMAGADRKFYPATAKEKENKIEVFCDKVPTPVAVRYAFKDYVSNAPLRDGYGLPISSFRTDDWE